jgi:hypothetical protein
MRRIPHQQAQRRKTTHYFVPASVDPAALLAGGGEHLPKRPPQPQRSVADHHHRRAHSPPAQVAQQFRPRIGRLGLAVGDGDQLLAAIGAHPDDDQAAQPSLVAEADVEVDPVGPAVHVVDPAQVPPRECGPLCLPLLHQPGDDRGRQPRRGAEEGLQRWNEVAARQPVQVQQRQHLGHLRRAAAPSGQQHAVELHARTCGRIHPTVIHSGTCDLDLADTGGDRARRGVPVAHHQAPAALVPLGGVGGQVGVDLCLQGGGQHPSCALPEQLVQLQAQLALGSVVGDYTQHRGVPSSPALARRRPLPIGQGGRYAALSCEGLIHRFRP